MTTITKQLADALRAVRNEELDGSEPAIAELLAAYDALPAEEDSPLGEDAATVDRLLGLADQFLEDWELDNPDGDFAERKQEWAQWRPRILACVNACQGIPTDLLESLDPGELDAAVNDGARDPSHPMLGR